MTDSLSDRQKAEFEAILKKPYKDQTTFFLNAFWTEIEPKAEEIWGHLQIVLDLDKQQYNALPEGKKAETYEIGDSLDEFWSHKMLEGIGKTLTVVQFRTEFKKIDTNTDKRMGMLEFLLWEYKQTPKALMDRPQGTGENAAEIETAQKLLDQVSAAFADAEKRKNELTVAEHALKQEMEALKVQEDAYNAKTAELQQKSEGSGVSAMRSKNELAQHLAEDPLPLRKAKLNTQAAAKKAEKARTVAEEAFEACAKKLHEAQAFLNEVRAKGGGPTLGTFWWMDRELQERKKFMPSSGKAVKLVNM